MISPTLIMETELDTESDSDSDDDDTINIYEEVLNDDTYNTRQHKSRLSTTSSVYSAGGWNCYYHKVMEALKQLQFFVIFHFSIFCFNPHP